MDQLTHKEELLKAHRESWLPCTRCSLGKLAKNHVLYDDKFEGPYDRIDILMIGEAPGNNEDILGIPFIGSSGKLLRKAINEAMYTVVTYVLTNAVACKPQDFAGTTFRKPTDKEIKACAPRIKELLQIYRPKMVILIGNVARDKINPIIKETEWQGKLRHIAHPSFIVRRGGERAPEYPTYVKNFKRFFKEVKEVSIDNESQD